MSGEVKEVSAEYRSVQHVDDCPLGYKSTEVGVIPEDWDSHPISEVCQLMTGSTPSTSNLNNYGDEYMFVSPADLKGQKYIRETRKNLSQSGFKICRKFPQGSVLFTCIGSTIGKCGIATKELTSNQQINAVLPDRKVDNEYIFYQLLYEAPRIKQQASEQAVPIINKSKFGESQIGLPKQKKEQTAIANALSDVDALITSLEKLIAKKRAIKIAAMQQLLTGKKRLPPFDKTHTGYKQSELGEIPEDWGLCDLESVSAFITKGSTPTTYGFKWEKEGVPFLRSECVSKNGLDLAESMFISVEANKVLRRSEIQSGDLLITITGNVGRVVYLGESFGEGNINQHIAKIRITASHVDPMFVVHYLSQQEVRKYFNSITTGQAYPQISLNQVRATEVPLPSLSEQNAISEALASMTNEIHALDERLNKTQQLKQGMMQELLTGKTRLIKPEHEAT